MQDLNKKEKKAAGVTDYTMYLAPQLFRWTGVDVTMPSMFNSQHS